MNRVHNSYYLAIASWESTRALILRTERSRVSFSIFAKQTRNQPGSAQWQEDPGETFNPNPQTIFFHRSISASNVTEFSRSRISTQQNNPALLFKQCIPAFFSPETSTLCLFLSLLRFSFIYLCINLLSASILDSRNWDCEEISPKLDIFVAAAIRVSFSEYIIPILKPGRPKSFDRLETTWTRVRMAESWLRDDLLFRASMMLMNLGVLKTVPEYISSLTMWRLLSMEKVMRRFSSSRLSVVPNGFDGLVMKRPLTLRWSLWACW